MNKYQLAKTITDPEILEQLSRDEDSLIRRWVAENSNTSVKTLNFLSRDGDWYVRCWVALNPNTSFEILKQMAIDEEDDYVRNWILKNPNCNDDLYMYIQGRFLLQTLSELST